MGLARQFMTVPGASIERRIVVSAIHVGMHRAVRCAYRTCSFAAAPPEQIVPARDGSELRQFRRAVHDGCNTLNHPEMLSNNGRLPAAFRRAIPGAGMPEVVIARRTISALVPTQLSSHPGCSPQD
jgi:hypothetical protein